MKHNVNKYETVHSLPVGAVPVAVYAADKGITTSWVYKQIRTKKARFKIIVYMGINWIVE